MLNSCSDTDTGAGENNNATPAPPTLMYNVVKVHPHDTASFIQGLAVSGGQLFESTGQYGTSWVGPLDLETGKIDRKISLPQEQFGEGITILNDKLYHLTWQNRKGYVYDLKTFNKIQEFSYMTEGWGITNDGSHLIMSDGSSNLYFFSPDSIRLVKTVGVTDNVGPVPNLNELEFIDGYIYANQWQTTYILKIEPSTGAVVGRLDFKQLENDVASKMPGADFAENALNGIAYDSLSKKIYVTGKRWPHLYEIKFQ